MTLLKPLLLWKTPLLWKISIPKSGLTLFSLLLIWLKPTLIVYLFFNWRSGSTLLSLLFDMIQIHFDCIFDFISAQTCYGMMWLFCFGTALVLLIVFLFKGYNVKVNVGSTSFSLVQVYVFSAMQIWDGIRKRNASSQFVIGRVLHVVWNLIFKIVFVHKDSIHILLVEELCRNRL